MTEDIHTLSSKQQGFGGLWVVEDDLIHVAVQAGHVEEIESLLGGKVAGQYVVSRVAHSYEDLIARRDAVSKQWDLLLSQGVELMEWGPDVENNTIWVSIVDYSESKVALARKFLGEDIVVNPSLSSGGAGDLYMITNSR